MIDSYCSTAQNKGNAWPRLLGDIGGTNARFAWQERQGADLSQVRVLLCNEFFTLNDAIHAYLDQTGLELPDWAAFGIANPVIADEVRMTNHHWNFSIESTRKQLGLSRLMILNDFTALALALPYLSDSNKVLVGEPGRADNGAIALIGPGTGLGVSGLLPIASGRWLPIVGEGGHVSLSASNPEEFAVVSCLQAQYEHVSAERVLSGQGLLNIYSSLIQVRGVSGETPPKPSELLSLAISGRDILARDTLNMFFGFLGSVAGDLALTLGARGGVFVGGGIAPRVKDLFLKSSFRPRFEAKGRFKDYLRDIPTWLIDAPISPALIGASVALDQGKNVSFD